MLEKSFKSLLSVYTRGTTSVNDYWNEIHTCYTQPDRYYHTLVHLGNLLKTVTEIQAQIVNWEALLFALYYHDIIYNPARSDNEAQSAMLARERMAQAHIPDWICEQTIALIMATRSHAVNNDADVNYFTDADLSILGQAPEIYKTYSHAIRKEYSLYPDVIYLPGRRKALLSFLQMDRIYKTDFFYSKYEEQARSNLKAEILLIDKDDPL